MTTFLELPSGLLAAIVLALCIGGAVLLWWLSTVPMRRALAQGAREETGADFATRLARPKVDELEAHFGAPAHPDYQWLVKERPIHDLLKRGDALMCPDGEQAGEVWFIAGAEPADLQAHRELVDWGGPPEGMPIAGDGCGGHYYVLWDTPPDQPLAVHFVDHDGEQRRVGPSLRDFLTWPVQVEEPEFPEDLPRPGESETQF